MPGNEAMFATTRWNVVLQAVSADSPQAREALDQLCRIYWKPLYVYLRRRGCSVHDAEDLTQAFLAYLLSHDALYTVERCKGKFRSFLLVSLNHFLANEWDKAQAQKRGGGQALVSLDDPTVEELYRREPVDELTPEKIYERRWALTVLEQVRQNLRAEYEAAGKGDRFSQLARFLPGETSPLRQAQATRVLGTTEGAFKVEVHRMRRRFREHLRAVIAQTVARPEEVDEELRYLIGVLTP